MIIILDDVRENGDESLAESVDRWTDRLHNRISHDVRFSAFGPCFQQGALPRTPTEGPERWLLKKVLEMSRRKLKRQVSKQRSVHPRKCHTDHVLCTDSTAAPSGTPPVVLSILLSKLSRPLAHLVLAAGLPPRTPVILHYGHTKPTQALFRVSQSALKQYMHTQKDSTAHLDAAVGPRHGTVLRLVTVMATRRPDLVVSHQKSSCFLSIGH